MQKLAKFSRFLPFLRWFPISGNDAKVNLLAGLTVALVLIPQSMAYAQLAGLPAYYGLYAAFLPVAIAAMWVPIGFGDKKKFRVYFSGFGNGFVPKFMGH